MARESETEGRTEDATPRKREEARDKGQVALSQELVAALMTCTGIAGLVLGGERLVTLLGGLVGGTARSLGSFAGETLTPGGSAAIVSEMVEPAMELLATLLLPVIGVGLIVGYGQVGFRVATKAVAPDISKLDPVKGLGRLFSLRSWVRTGLSAVKLAAIATGVISVALLHLGDVVRLGSSELGPFLRAVGVVVFQSASAGVLVMLAIAIVDFLFQRYQHDVDLRMTKEEVKEEHKTTEGDPHVRARVRALQREASRRRMMSEVPNATVVVTNPDHYAVALAYPRGSDGEPTYGAPRVVAKGADFLAQQIKKVAREAGVLCYEDVLLARTLYAQVAIGDEIPGDLYAAVAAVLNYVYRVEGAAAHA